MNWKIERDLEGMYCLLAPNGLVTMKCANLAKLQLIMHKIVNDPKRMSEPIDKRLRADSIEDRT